MLATQLTLHVLVSRVRPSKMLYVLGFDPQTQAEHLRKLKHPPALGIWSAGYDQDGHWDAERATQYATNLAETKHTSKSTRKRAAPTPPAEHSRPSKRTAGTSAR